MTRQELIAELVKVQNHPVHHCHDIMTITGFMSTEEVAQHLEACRKQIGS